MKQRCYSAEHESYPAYGGRGITVCERWRNSFAAFLEDMGECPSGHQLDRKDNDNPYCAENCRWVTPAANARNKSNSVTVTFAGRTLIVTDWAKELGVPRRTLDYRIKHWGVERAMVAAGAAHAEITG